MSLVLLTRAIILIGLIGTLGFAAYAGEPLTAAWWKGGIVMLIVLVVPFFLYWLMQAKMVYNGIQQWLLLLSAAIYSFGGLALMYNALIANPDAQGGLVMVVIPVYGSGLIILTAVCLLFTRKL
ncbi:MAG: hypothetical protein IMF09_05780 [Proteobacteria bacterium]|nr:hypothetical protein [Pseudomonadota bacterium]